MIQITSMMFYKKFYSFCLSIILLEVLMLEVNKVEFDSCLKEVLIPLTAQSRALTTRMKKVSENNFYFSNNLFYT